MGQLNLRGIDDQLVREVKATAASEGLTITAFVVLVLETDRKRGGWTVASVGGNVLDGEDGAEGGGGEAGSEARVVQSRGKGGGKRVPEGLDGRGRGGPAKGVRGAGKGKNSDSGAAKAVGCPECGSLSGHQRWCSKK